MNIRHLSLWISSLSSIKKRRTIRRRPSSLSLESLESRLLMTVPAFSSLPGADHTIFLDFDGQTVEGTNWNTYYNQTTLVAQPYGGTSLSIEDAWKRVSEDFRPFNINVTTVDPGIEALRKTATNDQQWGIRAIVTTEASMVTDSTKRTGAGGIAYIDSFNWSTDTPVWVYTTSGKNVAEAASHEVGHSLGLSHDGLADGSTAYYRGHGGGETGWASIMGVGYYQNVTQWDKGEYYNSNNAGSTANYSKGPDDLSIITTRNGFGYRADDNGNSNAQSSKLNTAGTTISDNGIIETTTDVDVFSFVTGTGSVVINVTPFTPGPNLDVKADLYDSAGTLVASSNNSAVLSAGFNINLIAGQYFLHIEGVGWGTPSSSTPTGYSDYSSLGQYFISGSIVVPETPITEVSISDSVANEADGTITFTVTLSQPAAMPTSVNWSTINGSAVGNSDFISNNGTLVFAAGETVGYITVSLVNDSVVENIESFTIELNSPIGLILADGSGVGTINDNDIAPKPSISINNVSVKEGNTVKKGRKNVAVQTTATFTVTLSAASSSTVSVKYTTKNGTATTANADYKLTSGTLSFSAGQISKTISVIVYGDIASESDEIFTVELSNAVNATIQTTSGIGTIVNDDVLASERKPRMIIDPMSHFIPNGDSHANDKVSNHTVTLKNVKHNRKSLKTNFAENSIQTLQLISNLPQTPANLTLSPKKSAVKRKAIVSSSVESNNDLDKLFSEPTFFKLLSTNSSRILPHIKNMM